jgi:hypothetical protein
VFFIGSEIVGTIINEIALNGYSILFVLKKLLPLALFRLPFSTSGLTIRFTVAFRQLPVVFPATVR